MVQFVNSDVAVQAVARIDQVRIQLSSVGWQVIFEVGVDVGGFDCKVLLAGGVTVVGEVHTASIEAVVDIEELAD